MKYLFVTAILLSTAICFGQIVDQFDDNNFENPIWYGDITNFVINSQAQLQLNDTTNGSSYIYTDYLAHDSFQLSIYFKMDFAPSVNNQLALYFILDTPDIKNANGFFIKIGENGSDDRWYLFQLNAGSETQIAQGPIGLFGEAPASGSIRIEYINRKMNIWTHQENDNSFQLDASIENIAINPQRSFFGIFCNYTSSRSDKFIFDDLYIGPLTQDVIPPEILSISILKDNKLELKMSERIDLASIELLHFEVNKGVGNPVAIELINDSLELILEFINPFVNNIQYQLMVENIKDLHGNEIAKRAYNFELLVGRPPQLGDLVISEFFPDPGPSQGIPEVEFVEIYNNANEVIDLTNLVLEINGRESTIPKYFIGPAEFLLLTKSLKADFFEIYGNVLGLSDFPIIKNGSGLLALKKLNGAYLHHVVYDESMIQESVKKDGGWSFEIINQQLYCEGRSNWKISKSELGGTPGMKNSNNNPLFNGTPLQLNTFLASKHSIRFEIDHNFYQPIDVSINPIFEIDHVLIDSISFDPPLYNSGTIHVALEPDRLYMVNIDGSEIPCGLSFIDKKIQFGIAQLIQPGDLIINEILFNPKNDGADYIEILNISKKVLNIQKLLIGNRLNQSLLDSLNYNFGFLPDQYLCITPNKENILKEYKVLYPESLFAAEIPALPNNSGNVTLFLRSPDTITIDEIFYQENMHHPLIGDPDGVALERINPIAKPFNRADWHSAAATVGYGTPTSKNSQGLFTALSTEARFNITNRVFSKESNEGNNVLKIDYELEKPGYVCNVSIYNIAGQLINKVYEQSLLSVEGQLFWNGKDDNESDMAVGVYVILIEAFHPSGDLIKEKLSCVLASYF